ncbi:MAG: fasciclin domain-containing protein [Hyphococcus sp.]
MPANTLLDIALSNPDINEDGNGDFNILAAALGLFPGLVEAAGDPSASLTVFAPTDEAFLNLANALNPAVGSDEGAAVATLASVSALLSPADDPAAFLKAVLTYHIAGGALTGADVIAADEIATLFGKAIEPDGLTLGDADDDFADPNVINPAGAENGIVAENGILHVIDNVLLPFDITVSGGGSVSLRREDGAVVGSDGVDAISLGRGDDIAAGLGGDDQIEGDRGNDLVLGGGGNDGLSGGRGQDTIEGGAGDDYIEGGRGDDTLVGQEGNDFLSGGNDADSFVFSPFRAGEGDDVVVDFDPTEDTLVLDLTAGDPALLDAIAAEGDPGLQFTDLLTFDTDASTPGVQAPVSLGASDDGDLLITHLTGTIELNGISASVDPAALIPAIAFLTPDDWMLG